MTLTDIGNAVQESFMCGEGKTEIVVEHDGSLWEITAFTATKPIYPASSAEKIIIHLGKVVQ